MGRRGSGKEAEKAGRRLAGLRAACLLLLLLFAVWGMHLVVTKSTIILKDASL